MIIAPFVDIGLALLVIGVAVWTSFTREAFSAVIGYVAYGLLLTLVWVRLYAVDAALTEAAVGSGMTGVLLIGAVIRLRPTQSLILREPLGLATKLLAGLLSGAVTIAIAAVVLNLPAPPPTLAPEAAASLHTTGLGNAVTGVLLAYRAWDTFLESFVLLLALIGVWSLAQDRYWGGAPRLAGPSVASGPLTFLAQVLPPFGIVVALHILWVGADAPGGKFQAGAILAAMWIIVMTARLAAPPSINQIWLRLALIVGPAAFLLIGIAGVGLADGFLAYPEGKAKPLIIVIECFMMLSVAATLGMIVAGPPRTEALK